MNELIMGTVCAMNAALFMIGFVIVLYNIVNERSKKSRYRAYSLGKFFITMGLLCFASVMIVLNHFSGDKTSDVQAEGFTIESYHVNLNVHEDNVVDVKEEVTVHFYETGHHGIYKIIPYWLKYTGKDGKTVSRKSEISDLIVLGENYTVDQLSGKAQIKIGDSNVTLPIGTHTYTISYTYNMGNDPYSDFDEFIFHTFGDFWGTEIKRASLEVTMPKDFDQTDIHFFADKYRKKEVTDSVNYYVIGNTLYANVSSNYELMKSLTVDIALPEGYFILGSDTYGEASITFAILIFILTIIAFIKWYRYGKDLQKISSTVEFYPPENYDASEIGYLYKNAKGHKLTVSLIVSLASKGYIKIEESKSKKTRTIVNLCPIKSNEFQRIIQIHKMESAIPLNKKNKKLMKELFLGNSGINITEHFEEFYKDCIHLIASGYIQIEHDTLYDYIETTYHKKSLTMNEKLVYEQLFRKKNENILSSDEEFYTVFDDVTTSLSNKLDDIIYDTNAYKKMNQVGTLLVIAGICWFFMLSVEDLNPKYIMLYWISFIFIILIAVFMFLMKRKTSYGEQIHAKIMGFKNYLETAEKNRINQLVEENPNYFFDILPYAYVLDVSKKWIEKFEDIPIPEDMGNFDYSNIDSFNQLYHSISIPSSSSSSSSGCSSCGGGCSSCGGGGSW